MLAVLHEQAPRTGWSVVRLWPPLSPALRGTGSLQPLQGLWERGGKARPVRGKREVDDRPGPGSLEVTLTGFVRCGLNPRSENLLHRHTLRAQGQPEGKGVRVGRPLSWWSVWNLMGGGGTAAPELILEEGDLTSQVRLRWTPKTASGEKSS